MSKCTCDTNIHCYISSDCPIHAAQGKAKETISAQQKQIEVLTKAFNAHEKMVLHYRLGKPSIPEWVFKALDKARKLLGENDG